MTTLNTLGQAVLTSIEAFINVAHAKGDRDSLQSAADMAAIKRRVEAVLGELPAAHPAGSVPTTHQMQQAQAEPHLPGREPRPMHMGVNDTPREPGWDAGRPEPQMPRIAGTTPLPSGWLNRPRKGNSSPSWGS